MVRRKGCYIRFNTNVLGEVNNKRSKMKNALSRVRSTDVNNCAHGQRLTQEKRGPSHIMGMVDSL